MEQELKSWLHDALAPGVWVVEDAECGAALRDCFGLRLAQLLQPFCNLLGAASQRHRLTEKSVLGPRLPVDVGVRLYDRSRPPTTLDDLVNFLRKEAPVTEPGREPPASALPLASGKATSAAEETNTLLSRCNRVTDLVSRNSRAVSALLGGGNLSRRLYPYWVEESWDWISHLAGQNVPPICAIYAVKAEGDVVERIRSMSNCEASELVPASRLYLAVEIRDAAHALKGAEALDALQRAYPPEWCRLLSLTLSTAPSPRWLLQARTHNWCPSHISQNLPPLPLQSLNALQGLGETLVLDFCLPAIQIRKRSLEFQARQLRRGFRSQVKAYFSTTTRKSDETLHPLLHPDAPSQVLSSLGGCYLALGEYERSLECCKAAIVEAKVDRCNPPSMALLQAAAASLLSHAKQPVESVSEPELVRDAVNWLAQLCANHTAESDLLMSVFYRTFSARVFLILATHVSISGSAMNEKTAERAMRFLELAVHRLTELRQLLETPSAEASSLTRCYLRGVSLTGVAMCLDCVAALLLCYPNFDRPGLKEKVITILRNRFPSRSNEETTSIDAHLVDIRSVFPWASHTYQASRQVTHFLYRSFQAYKASGFELLSDWTAGSLECECLSIGCRLEGSIWRRGLGQWAGALEILRLSDCGRNTELLMWVLSALQRNFEASPEAIVSRDLPGELLFCFPLLVSSRWLRRQRYVELVAEWRAFRELMAVKKKAFGQASSAALIGLETVSPRYRAHCLKREQVHASRLVPSFESLLAKFAAANQHSQLTLIDRLVQNDRERNKIAEAAAGSIVRVCWVLFNPLSVPVTLSDIYVSFTCSETKAVISTKRIEQRVMAAASVEFFEADLTNFTQGTFTAETLHLHIDTFNLFVTQPLHGPPHSWPSRLLSLWDNGDFAGDGNPVSFVSPAIPEPKLTVRSVSTDENFPFVLMTNEVAECALEWSSDFQPTVVAIATSSNLHLQRLSDQSAPFDSKLIWHQGQRKARFNLFASEKGVCLIRMAALRLEGGNVEAYGIDFVGEVEDAVTVSSARIEGCGVCALTIRNLLPRDNEVLGYALMYRQGLVEAKAPFSVHGGHAQTIALIPTGKETVLDDEDHLRRLGLMLPHLVARTTTSVLLRVHLRPLRRQLILRLEL